MVPTTLVNLLGIIRRFHFTDKNQVKLKKLRSKSEKQKRNLIPILFKFCSSLSKLSQIFFYLKVIKISIHKGRTMCISGRFVCEFYGRLMSVLVKFIRNPWYQFCKFEINQFLKFEIFGNLNKIFIF